MTQESGNLGSPGARESRIGLLPLRELSAYIVRRFPHSSVGKVSAMQETRVQLMGLEEPPEKEMATHSSILAWRIPLTEKPGGLQSVGSQESDTI